jgi:hypothetical protein
MILVVFLKKQAFTINIKDKAKNVKIHRDQNDSLKATKEQLDEFENIIIKKSQDKSLQWNKDFYYQLYQFCQLKNINN